MDRTAYGDDLELKKKLLLRGEDKTTEEIYEMDNMVDRLNLRFENDKDDIAIVAKENLLMKPFNGQPNPQYPSPWLTVTYGEFGDIIKACAYVLKKKYDLYPNSRVGIIGNFTPLNHMLIYALWYMRVAVVQIPNKLGNDVKQFWCRLLNLKMIFYDVNFEPFDDKESMEMKKNNDEWIWKWQHPLTENEKNLEAGQEGVLAVNLFGESFREEILKAKNEGKSYQQKGTADDIIYIIGTSSTSQAVIKNGQCTKMKFVPLTTTSAGECYNKCIQEDLRNKPTFMINIPVSHALGLYGCVLHNIQCGGAVVYHTQNLRDIGFIPEIILDDMVETNIDHTILFPFHFNEIKKLFDNHHPHCEKWKKFISTRSKYCFKNGGAPLSDEIDNWFINTFGIRTRQDYGSSETGSILYSDFSKPSLPGEETYLSKLPWCDLYLKPLDDENPNVGLLYVRSPTVTTGYISKANIGEFYESSMPGMRTDIEADELFTMIEGKKFLRTNDIWRRSPLSGKYKYVTRADDVLVFQTGLKMNPLPFENIVTSTCDDIKVCCLIMDESKTEVVCFVEPQWEKIMLDTDNNTPVDTSVDATTLSKMQLENLNKLAQKQIWNSIYNLLMDDSKSLTTWAKQLTMNNIVIIDYGKNFPTTAKGSLSRRVAKVQYAYVLKRIAKLISGEIKSLEPMEGEDIEEESTEMVDNATSEKSTKAKDGDEDESDDDTFNDDEFDSLSDDDVDDDETEANDNDLGEDAKDASEEIEEAIRIIHESIKEIIPSTPDFNEFNPEAPFTVYGIDSLSTIKLTNVLSRKFNKRYSPAILFNYGSTVLLAKHLTGHEDVINEELLAGSKVDGDKSSSSKKIAIIGMALRLPGAINNSKSLWMALAKGKDCVLPPVKTRDLHLGYVNKPADQLGPEEHYLPRIGCYDTRSSVAKPSEFDANFFNCLLDEAVALDPRHRWILETSWEALENAGIAPNSLENTTTGVFVGINNDHEHEDLLNRCDATPPLAYHATAQSSIAGRLSYFYRLFGPSYTIDTACSTGASALHSACQSMQCGDCDLSIVTGVKYMYSSKEFHKTCAARMTSPNGRCATFDASADGFAQSEGCVTFVLKRLDDAIRDKDNILSVILGSCSGQSGLRQSISAPSSEGQLLSIKRAMKFAGITPDQVSYVEAHGTGTPLGDALEVHALNQVYGGSHSEENPLIVGSIKSNIGHTCEAAGLAGIAKVIVSMKHHLIPRNIHFSKLNPEIDLSAIPMKIPTKNLPWVAPDEKTPLIAQVSSFGLQGSIIVTFLEQYIPEETTTDLSGTENEKEKEQFILTISAKSHNALLELYESYMNILENMEDDKEEIANLCYTSNVGRQHFEYRLVASGSDLSELIESLEEEMDKFEAQMEDEDAQTNGRTSSSSSSNGHSSNNSHVYLYAEEHHDLSNLDEETFQYASFLYRTQPVFRDTIKDCDKTIKKLTEHQYSLVKVLTQQGQGQKDKMNSDLKGTDQYLGDLIVLALHTAFTRLIQSTHAKENNAVVFGFGYGELAAILNAGGISFERAAQFLRLIFKAKNGATLKLIKKWHKTISAFKLHSNVFLLSKHHEYKKDKVLPLHVWISIADIFLNRCENEKENVSKLEPTYINKGNAYLIKTYGDNLHELTMFSIKPELSSLIDGSLTGVAEKNQLDTWSQVPIFIFNACELETDYEKIYDDYLIENYRIGNEINWKEFHKRLLPKSEKEYPLQKIELPNYPFQRSTYWPTLKN